MMSKRNREKRQGKAAAKALYLTDRPELKEPWRHNYFDKVANLNIRPGTVNHVDIRHDDGCAVFGGGYCDCDPDVELRP
jgi:hypothetical protein